MEEGLRTALRSAMRSRDQVATAALRSALDRLAGAGIAVVDAGVRRPTLDDVFLTLTGSGTGS